MKITGAEFTISAVSPAQYPIGYEPEIALVGRSNVGKSSLINKLLNRKKLARTSSQPGKTRTLNFYHINDTFYFVDLPGYGYAKTSLEERRSWGTFINRYLNGRRQLVGIIMLVDIRHPPSADDKTMFEWLDDCGIPYVITATKADKISRGHWQKNTQAIVKQLKPETQELPLIVFSAENGAGAEEIWAWIGERLQTYEMKKDI